ncbi:hypothetical protein FRC04_010352 [Tulasnella sp. 424]|nr:hypothetical protein FRC04_010352 [Tulasnella sp. 424]KAG8978711.1 hypothetical protein FRC05_009984 [Tulasnella sp. 425]
MTALPLELWLIILECLGLADLRIARQVCRTWHQWAFKIRWRSHPVPLQDIISLQEPLEPIPKKRLKECYRSTILGSSRPSRDSVYILFNIAARITTIVINSVIDVDAIPLLKGLVASSSSKALFPALRSVEYAVEAAYSDINEIITGSRLKKIIIRSTPYDEIDGLPQIFQAFQHHQDLEELDLAGDRAFDFSQVDQVPWPLQLRRLHFNGVWTFRSWKELVERCVELRHAKVGFYSREPSALEDMQSTITARNLGVLDLDDVRHSHRALLILRRTEMPELRELSFKLGEDALQEGTDDEVEEALRVLGEKSPKLGRLRVETWVPLETELLSKFRGLETLQISNQAGEAWPWVYWDEDIEIIARSMPRLAHLRLPGLTHREPGTTMAALDSLATHCKRLHTLAIGIDATEFHFHEDVVTPFGKTLTSMTFLPLRLPTSAAALLARNLLARMPGVDRFQGRTMGLEEGGRAFYWDDGLEIIKDTVEKFRNGGVAEIWW